MITFDTSGLVAFLDRKDHFHAACIDTIGADQGPLVIPSPILAEIAYIIESKFGQWLLDDLLQDIEEVQYRLDCGDGDVARIRQLVSRYSDMPLGFADSAVVACAERHGGRVLTLDLRHFGVVARDAAITVLP